MDLKKSLNKVANLNGYMNFTQEIVSTHKEIVLPFNMSTVLTLKKIRSLEVEYFSKLQKTGAAFIIVEHMLSFPPSKTWSLLSVEIVNLLNYWLEVLRKYLILHSPSWWTFCKGLLGFFSDIRFKDSSVSNIVLKQSAEGLLDLSTSDKLSPEQRSEVVICLNQVCSHSSREMRIALQDNCAPYLVQLASDLAKCVHVPTQFAILELLMRWLPNRQDRKVRESAATLWFPATLFSEKTIDIFIERNFVNFFKDAREFLNQHNSASDHIISVVCRRLTVGQVELISVSDKWESWLELGVSSGSLVAMVDVRRLQTLGLPSYLREHLTLTADNAEHAIAYREPLQIMLVITTLTPPQLTCKESQQLLSEQACDVKIWISSKCHFDAVDLALRMIFGDKYKCVENRRPPELIQSSDSNRFSASEEDTRFSHPIEDARPRKSGYVVNKRASGWKSPSTTSTTSLAHLQEKLSAFPRLRYDKEPTGICVAPDLSCVTEISEPDDEITFAPTGKNRPYGVRNKTRVVNRSKTSPSDNDEGLYNKKKYLSPILDSARGKSPNCLLSATIGAHEKSIINDTLEALEFNLDDDVVDLLAQEAFAAPKAKDVQQDSGINVSNRKSLSNSVVRLNNPQKLKRDNTKRKEPVVISKSSSEDTSASFQNVLSEYKSHLQVNKGDTISNVIKSTTTDESNTEAINETPVQLVKVPCSKGTKRAKTTSADSERYFKNIGQAGVLHTTVDKGDSPKKIAANDIDEFFSRHVQENNNGDLIISPTLARKINEFSSDTSDSFDKYFISNVDGRSHLQIITEFEENQNIVDPDDVLGCLNQIIDKVCEDLDKCSMYMKKDTKTKTKNTSTKSPKKMVETDSDFIPDTASSKSNPIKKDKPQKTNLKLVYKNTKIKKAPVKINAPRNTKAQSPIKTKKFASTPETKEATEMFDAKTGSSEPIKKDVLRKKAPAKRKRKLYSPKDEDKQTGINIPETEEDNSLPANANPQLYTPKATSTIYKDIEKARKDRKDELKTARPTRKRGKVSESPLSPRSIKKNEVFDKLKENVENVSIKLVDKNPRGHDFDVYNYESESEGEDFKAKRIDLQKSKGTPIGSTGSKRTTRSRDSKLRNRVDYCESRNGSSAEDVPVKKTVSKKKRAKQQAKPKKAVTKLINEPIRDVRDERMRAATENTLNTSFAINDVYKNTQDSDLEPLSKLVRRMEPIPEVSLIEDNNVTEDVERKLISKKRSKRLFSLKKGQNNTKINVDSSANEDTSPLPALIIERKNRNNEDKDADSISSSKLIKGCENVIQFGENVDTTQNLLSEGDKISYSPETQAMPIELEIRQNLDSTNEDNIDLCNDIINISEPPKTVHKVKLCKEAIVLIQKDSALFQSKTSKPKTPEVIIDTHAEGSEISILTVCNSPKTAQGTSNEEPPNQGVLKQKPNESDENVDLSTSMKNFFMQLYKEFNVPSVTGKKQKSSHEKLPDTDENLDSPQKKVNKKTKDSKRAVAGITINLEKDKLHENSQYTSQIEFIELSSPRSINNIAKRTSPTNSTPSLQNPSSPTVVLNRLDPDEVRKWLPSPKSTLSEESKNVLNMLNKQAKPTQNTNVQTKTRAQKKTMNKEITNLTKKTKTVSVRKSTISPIKDFDEIEPSEPTVQSKSVPSVTKLTSSTKKENKTQKRNITKTIASSLSENSINDMAVKPLERKRQAPAEVVLPKKRRLTIEKVQSQTSTVVDAATEWIQGTVESFNEPQGRSEYIECLQMVLEKLDTTLMDIHHKTSQNMVQFFVDMQRSGQELSEIMEVRLKSNVTKILEQCTRIAEQTMTNYREECVTLQNEHNKKMKANAIKLIRTDCQRKQALIAIMREDIQAVLDHLERTRET